ncbi:hypothetical protein Scep_027414 [Stephania cephalantha]|uniref:Uncharacterized protein n=1 Tax=Stephania cephalantha TaxID=152367 RepID=A0AAP0HKR9_9MAGN
MASSSKAFLMILGIVLLIGAFTVNSEAARALVNPTTTVKNAVVIAVEEKIGGGGGGGEVGGEISHARKLSALGDAFLCFGKSVIGIKC